MHVADCLSRWVGTQRAIKHRARQVALSRIVQALLVGQRLSLSHLGRHRAGRGHPKHHIKAVDRLLGNRHLHAERDDLYREMAGALLAGVPRPVLIVDWSDFELGRKWLMLKAAVPVGGHAISIYERVFPFKRYNSPGAHREFLAALKSIIPQDCRPIIVTDAGFRGPWFRAVEANRWDWVGRVRNRIKYFNESSGRWCYTDSLYSAATPKVKHIGRMTLSRRHGYEFNLYLVRAYKLRRGRPPARGPKKQNTTLYRRLHRAPWLLATSLPHVGAAGALVKSLYTKRMQIEETFRDVKCHRWGFALRYARSNHAQRLEVLLLVATLATLVLWIAGLHVCAAARERHYQANTERRRRVLSIVFLGQQLVRRCLDPLPNDAFEYGLCRLNLLAAGALWA